MNHSINVRDRHDNNNGNREMDGTYLLRHVVWYLFGCVRLQFLLPFGVVFVTMIDIVVQCHY